MNHMFELSDDELIEYSKNKSYIQNIFQRRALNWLN